jgi:hypothetical protein
MKKFNCFLSNLFYFLNYILLKKVAFIDTLYFKKKLLFYVKIISVFVMSIGWILKG